MNKSIVIALLAAPLMAGEQLPRRPRWSNKAVSETEVLAAQKGWCFRARLRSATPMRQRACRLPSTRHESGG